MDQDQTIQIVANGGLEEPEDEARTRQLGAATMLRQSGNILDIAKAICNRSNRVLGFVNQHRVTLSRRIDVVWPIRANQVLSLAPCASHAMACARMPCSTKLKTILDAAWSASRNLIAFGITTAALSYSTTSTPFGPAPMCVFHLRLSSTTYCSKLAFASTGSAFLCLVC